MRTIKTFEVVHLVKKTVTYGGETYPPREQRHVTGLPTGWKSPVPYLFGGLAAMLGLIAFALLILACSYWRLSGHMGSRDDSEENVGEKVKDAEMKDTIFANSVLVIMAGEEKPTFLATPATSRATSFGDSDGKLSRECSCSCSSSSSSNSSSRGVGDGDQGRAS